MPSPKGPGPLDSWTTSSTAPLSMNTIVSTPRLDMIQKAHILCRVIWNQTYLTKKVQIVHCPCLPFQPRGHLQSQRISQRTTCRKIVKGVRDVHILYLVIQYIFGTHCTDVKSQGCVSHKKRKRRDRSQILGLPGGQLWY